MASNKHTLSRISQIKYFKIYPSNALFKDPAITFFDRMASVRDKCLEATDKEKPSTTEYSLDILEQLVAAEENYYANILLKCLKLCTSAFCEFLVRFFLI